jgi:hypothetical protein
LQSHELNSVNVGKVLKIYMMLMAIILYRSHHGCGVSSPS